ncbi:MAG: DEAD/DEAH box helicase family protein [Acidobacteria bacterium]|nr:DEAD/DEAH box helicase family protein [Acidobacteriota bacterium]
MHLHERLAIAVNAWRAAGYPTESHQTIAEILEWAHGTEQGNVRFLRWPQLRALETYWYLRLARGTPRVVDLYRDSFPKSVEFLKAIGLGERALMEMAVEHGVDGLLERVRRDDEFVRAHRLEAVRETLTLEYPSYILALAMGAGKTVLIGAIIATEFAMALEHPSDGFVHNALVFAPGKTILESLRELLSMPYEGILPPRLQKRFAASVKMTFTRDGEKDVPVIRGSHFNIVVTNTEKIRIQKETIRRSDLTGLLAGRDVDRARTEVANLRLQAIASLPHLAVFSDEAHHTYGQSLDAELKKVRKTVDYLSATTNVLCVVNTTGTPYFRKQPLRDVVIWYGLSEGIRDGILKDVAGSIQALHLDGDARHFVSHVIEDFFRDYRDVHLPNGAASKLALYFPQMDDLRELRPVVDEALVRAGLSPALCLVNTSDSSLTRQQDIDAFNRLNDPASPHRVILLVNKGTEGWNCPSLFASALARKLRASNNFVLQAATRCLRQVPGNTSRARIYLTHENYGVLDRQLQETYGERIADLEHSTQELRRARLVVRKIDIPAIALRKRLRTVVRQGHRSETLELTRPPATTRAAFKRLLTLGEFQSSTRVLQQMGESVSIDTMPATLDLYGAAVELASSACLDTLRVVGALRTAYKGDEIPEDDLPELQRQIEEQTSRYETREHPVEVALALVRLEGFARETDADGSVVYTAQIAYPVDKERYLLRYEDHRGINPRDVGFHYSPLDFDSMPEMSFFEKLLAKVNIEPWEVEDIYFTGGITDPAKTDFFVEYKDLTGQWRRYTPDFVIRKKAPPGMPPGSGRICIVEIKADNARHDPINGEQGTKSLELHRWERLNADRLKYEMIFTASDAVEYDLMKPVWRFCEEREPYLPIELDRERIAAFCRRWKISELSLFGSILRPWEFRPDSDVDFLATFAPEDGWSLFDHMQMEEELSAIVGRKVDLLTRPSVERSHNWIRRRSILESARTIYVS